MCAIEPCTAAKKDQLCSNFYHTTMKKHYAAMVLTLSLCVSVFAQQGRSPAHEQQQRTNELPSWALETVRGGIANDECAGAIMLIVGEACVPTGSSYAGATESMTSVTCNGFTATVANDVWFSFVATTDGTTIEVDGTPSTDPVVEVFSGTCGALTSIGCADHTFLAGTEIVSVPTTIGQTYYIRTYNWPGGTPPADYGFTACIYATPPPPPAPANDECVNAVMLVPAVECAFIPGTWTAATQSMAPATCNTYTATLAHDTWYGFTATTSISTVHVQGATENDPVLELFSGTCGSLTSLDCRDHTFGGGMESLEYATEPGTTYYFRTYYWYTGFAPAVMDYTACVVAGAGTVGVKGTEMGGWSVYPNPSNGAFTLMNAGMSGPVDLRLIDLGGRTVYSTQLITRAGGRHEIDLGAGIASGSYLLHTTGEGISHVQRLVIN
jgi:hypothetical protein